MRSGLFVLFGALISALVVSAWIYSHRLSPNPSISPLSSPSPLASTVFDATASPSPNPSPSGVASASPTPAGAATNLAPDLTADANGLSKATVVLNTSEGVIKFKFYPQDAPKTVARMIDLINKGFYNGLVFHRVVPGFVIQGGDPAGNGTGGSGQKLDAEFNSRKHTEGTVAMARAADPNSADSQFYISLGTHPHLDNKYTVFGQVIEGMDTAKKIKAGDKMMSMSIQ
jgi:cyclophilin family peptidyl-prolyl cis-trans isomerase